jgi:hypothetical protein
MTQNTVPEIELTLQDITEGSNFIRSVVLRSSNPNYNGKTIKYHSLDGDRFALAMENAGLTGNQDPSESFRFLMEICKLGIVNKEVARMFAKADQDVIQQVGKLILGVSKLDEKQTENFSKAQQGV